MRWVAMRWVAVCLALLALPACSAHTEGEWNPAVSPARGRLPLAAIQTRDYRVMWLAGGRLRVEDAHGSVVAEGPAEDVLARVDPFLRLACVNATAAAGVDASLRLGDGVPRAELAPARGENTFVGDRQGR